MKLKDNVIEVSVCLTHCPLLFEYIVELQMDQKPHLGFINLCIHTGTKRGPSYYRIRPKLIKVKE